MELATVMANDAFHSFLAEPGGWIGMSNSTHLLNNERAQERIDELEPATVMEDKTLSQDGSEAECRLCAEFHKKHRQWEAAIAGDEQRCECGHLLEEHMPLCIYKAHECPCEGYVLRKGKVERS